MIQILLSILIMVALCGIIGAAVFLIWIEFSPMFAVRILRRYDKAQVEYPEDFSEYEQKAVCHRNLSYPSYTDCNQVDLYLPKERNGRSPVLLWIHGGSFVAGVKEGEAHWATMLASEGLAVAAFEYRRAPEAHWPSQLIQLGECCSYLRSVADTYGLDMDRVILAGDSAGGHIAAQFALIQTSGEFSALSGLEPVLKPGCLRAVLLYCSVLRIMNVSRINDRKLRFLMSRIGWSYFGKRRWADMLGAKMSPIKDFVTGAFPPTYLTDGNSMSFEAQGRELVRSLEEKDVRVASRFFPKEEGAVGHGFTFAMKTPNARLVYTDTVCFLRQLGLLPDSKGVKNET